MSDKIFSDGIFFKEKRVGAPDFVLGGLDFKVDEAIEFLKKHKNDKGYVNLDLKVSKGGKKYLELNTYQKADAPITPEQIAKVNTLKESHNKVEYSEEEISASEIPF